MRKQLSESYRQAQSAVFQSTCAMRAVAMAYIIELLRNITHRSLRDEDYTFDIDLSRLNAEIPQLRLDGRLVEGICSNGLVAFDDGREISIDQVDLDAESIGLVVTFLETTLEEVEQGLIRVTEDEEDEYVLKYNPAKR